MINVGNTPYSSRIELITKTAAEDRKTQGNEYDDDDTAVSRFVARLSKYMLEGCVAKDKTVRYCVLQCIAEMITHLGEIELVLHCLWLHFQNTYLVTLKRGSLREAAVYFG